ncbi:MAG: hypothetical protein IJV46_00230 [Acidaminococcaceae bacterium]|nr:hypothetical protein [Acidaminococcaceae bacterium]
MLDEEKATEYELLLEGLESAIKGIRDRTARRSIVDDGRIRKESGDTMKTVICKARKDSMKDTPTWIDPVWQILHTNTRYELLPECIKKRCRRAKFKEIIERGETFSTVEYRDTVYGKKGPFYIETDSLKIVTKKEYLKCGRTGKYRPATEKEVEDYRYYPVYYFNKFDSDLYMVSKIYVVTAQHDYKLYDSVYVKAGQPFLLAEADLHYWKLRTDYKNDFTYHLATQEEIEQYEYPYEEAGMKADARINKSVD